MLNFPAPSETLEIELGYSQIFYSSELLLFSRFPLTPPTQDHRPMRNPLLTKAGKTRNLSTLF